MNIDDENENNKFEEINTDFDPLAELMKKLFGDKVMKHLWGDSFFNAKKKTWTNLQQPGGCTEPLQRAFCR